MVVIPLICWEIKVSECIIELSLLLYLAEWNTTLRAAKTNPVKNWNSLHWMKKSWGECQPTVATYSLEVKSASWIDFWWAADYKQIFSRSSSSQDSAFFFPVLLCLFNREQANQLPKIARKRKGHCRALGSIGYLNVLDRLQNSEKTKRTAFTLFAHTVSWLGTSTVTGNISNKHLYHPLLCCSERLSTKEAI